MDCFHLNVKFLIKININKRSLFDSNIISILSFFVRLLANASFDECMFLHGTVSAALRLFKCGARNAWN